MFLNVPGIHEGLRGFTLENLGFDLLHAGGRGVVAAYVATALYCILDSACLLPADCPRSSKQEMRKFGIQYLRRKLKSFYNHEHDNNLEDRVYHLNRWTPTMLGPVTKPFKAAETQGLLKCVLSLFQENLEATGDRGKLLYKAGLALGAYYAILRDEQRVLNPRGKI